MVRTTVRRAAVFAATGALAVLAGAGPALAAGGAPVPGTHSAVVAVGQLPAGEPAPPPQWCPPHHHHGLLSGLLDGVGRLLDGLL